MKVKSSLIQVALSNPPKKAETSPAPPDPTVRSLGGTREQEFGPRGKGRSQLAFTPRVLATPPRGQAAAKLAPMKFVKPGGTGGGGGGGDQPPKTSVETTGSQ